MPTLSKLISTVEESRTLAITSLIKKLKSEGKNVLSFSAGEPDFPTPIIIKEAGIKAINENFTRYTANEGYPEIIKSIIKKFKKDNNLDFTSEQILVSNGAKHSLYNIIMSVCNPGDEVIFQSPYWVSYPEIVKLANSTSIIIDAGVESDFKITPQQLEKAITTKTKAFIFNSPSNPTGAVYSEKEIKEIAEVLIDKDIFIISDEIYERIIFDNEKHFAIGSIDKLKEKTITINGVSKTFSMTGWRIGYAAGPKNVIQLARNLQSHSTSNAASISQYAANSAILNNIEELDNMVENFRIRRDYLVNELNKINGIKCPNPKGAFYVFYDISGTFGKSFNDYEINNSTTFCNYLLTEELVGLVPGIAFGNDNCVRMSFACSLEELKEGVERIKKGIDNLS